MSGTDVVVIIVSYRCARLTIESLRSVERERGKGLRLQAVVVDNASGDAPEIAAAISDNGWTEWATLIVSPVNGGFSYGCNMGISFAYEQFPPQYFHLLNPDAQLGSKSLLRLVHFLEAHPQIGIVGSRLEDGSGRQLSSAFRFPSLISEAEYGLQVGVIRRILRRWVVSIDVTDRPQKVDWVSGASMMISRRVVDRIGGLDEHYFLYYDDADFCFRAKNAGFETWCLPDSQVRHISGQSSKLTGEHEGVTRMPPYWFASRRRFLLSTRGYWYSVATDVVSILAHSMGALKRLIQGRVGQGPPHFAWDVARLSLFKGKHFKSDPLKTYLPTRSSAQRTQHVIR